MRIRLLLLASLLSGCAGPLLNTYTEYLGPKVGSLEERQVLQNLAHFVDNPWAMPGHVELANGQIQATNQLGVNLKYPYSSVINSTSASSVVTKGITRGEEFDINPAQTQDQESYNLLPVTDPDDLRRLRAIYHYAICPDPEAFMQEWEIADQFIFQPVTFAKSKPDKSKETDDAANKKVTLQVRSLLQDYKDGKVDENHVLESLPGRVTSQNKGTVQGILDDLIAPHSTLTVEKATKQIMQALGVIYQPYAAPTPSKTGSKDDSTKSTTGGDTIAFEQLRARLILSPYGLGTKQWLYWSDGAGTISASCGGQIEYPRDAEHLIRLGSSGAREFYTDDPKKFSDLILFVLGGIPNTTGAHVLSASNSPASTKSSKQQFFSVGGQTGVTIPSK
jgi:hypothetical protein